MSHPSDPIAALVDDIVARLAERVVMELRSYYESQLRPTPEPRYLGERAVAERLGISVRTLQGWRAVGRGPSFRKAGRRVIYEVAALERFLDGSSASAGGAAPHPPTRVNPGARRASARVALRGS